MTDSEHFNTIMWTLIHIGLGLSTLIIFKISTENYALNVAYLLIIFGWLVLTYFSLIIFKSNKRRLQILIDENGESTNNGENFRFIEKFLPTILLSTIKVFIFGLYGFYFFKITPWAIIFPILSISLEGIYFYKTIDIINHN